MAKSEAQPYLPAPAPIRPNQDELRRYLDEEFDRIAVALRLRDIDLEFGGLAQLAGETVNVGTTPQKLNFTEALPSLGMVADVVNDRIVVASGGTFFAAITINMEANVNVNLTIEAYLNGAATGRTWTLKFQSGGQQGATSFSSQTLAIGQSGDYLEYFINVDAGTASVELKNINLVLIRLTGVVPE